MSIQVQNISKSYKNNPLRLFLLMSKEEIFGLIGPDGAGKKRPDIDYTLQ
jgi:ABC-type lipopolysaccharide export system ATPase subunit